MCNKFIIGGHYEKVCTLIYNITFSFFIDGTCFIVGHTLLLSEKVKSMKLNMRIQSIKISWAET